MRALTPGRGQTTKETRAKPFVPRYEAIVVRFFTGFLTASLLWGGLAALVFLGVLPFPGGSQEAPEVEIAPGPDPAPSDSDDKPKRKRLKKPRVSGPEGGRAGSGSGSRTIGDDLDWSGSRQVDMAAGEGQLSGKQIEAGFDSVMGKIRRCLILVPSDDEIQGKLLFGMRVGSDGKARAVQLSGPSVVIGGESGSCLRDAAQSIRFATFDGPDMLFKYPITLQ